MTISLTRYKPFGDHAFAFAGPKLWNNLSLDMRAGTDVGIFKIKTETIFI